MSKYFVTGGAGFIGSCVVDKLLGVGNKVVIYDDLSSGSVGNISDHLGNSNFQFIEGNILDYATLGKAMRGCEAVFHLAAHSDIRNGTKDTKIDLENETIGTYNVVEAMRNNGISRLIFSSSATVYGDAPSVSLSENYGPLFPISLYGAGKLAGEGLISAYSHLFGLQAWIYRFANIVGTRGNHGVIFDFVHKLKANPSKLEVLGDGSQTRPYLHVRECVGGILFGFEHAKEKLNLFNIGVESETNIIAVANFVAEEMGIVNLKLAFTGGDRGWKGDAPRLRFDMTKMRQLGWCAALSSDEAVKLAAKEVIAERT